MSAMISEEKHKPNRAQYRPSCAVMGWRRNCWGAACLVVFVFGSHLLTLERHDKILSRQKRDANTSSSDNVTASVNSPGGNATGLNIGGNTRFIQGNSTSNFPNQPPLNQTTAASNGDGNVGSIISSPNTTTQSPDTTITSASNSSLQTTITSPNTQEVTITHFQDNFTTAEEVPVSQPTVINTTSTAPIQSRNATSPTTVPTTTSTAPPSTSTAAVQTTTTIAVQPTTTAEAIIVSTAAGGVISPPSTRGPITTTTTDAVIIYTPKDDDDQEKSLNRLAIILPIAIFVVLAAILVAVIICCRYGLFRRKNKSKNRGLHPDGHDLWVGDGGIDNIAALDNSDMMQREKDFDADDVSISAVMRGGKLYEVDFAFEASEDAHLELDPGSIVEVIEKLDSGWWRGFVGDQEGWFPATYVHTLDKQHTTPSPDVVSQAAVNQAFDAVSETTDLIPEKKETEKPLQDVASVPDSLHEKLMKAISEEVGKKSHYIALGDYQSESSDELSMKKGELLTHMNKDPGGWTRVKNSISGENGWVPTSYLQQISSDEEVFAMEEAKPELLPARAMDKPEMNDLEPEDDEFYDDEELDVDWEAEFDEDQDELTGIEHNAIHPYTAQREGDLSLQPGDTVIVFEMLSNGWWRGCCNKQEGWFPATYVEAVAQTPRDGDGSSQSDGWNTTPEHKRVTLQMDHNVEYPPPPAEADSSLERRMLADQREKESDPTYSPSAHAQQSPGGEKPAVPVRFVKPKLVRVNRGTLNRSARGLKRPRRPAPAPPSGVEPYRTLTKHSVNPKRKPPPPPKRTVTSKVYTRALPDTQAQSKHPPPPPQRTVVPKLINLSGTSPPPSLEPSPRSQSPLDGSGTGGRVAERPRRPSSKLCPTRPAPPAPAAVLEARAQSMQSLASSTGSLVPPPVMFMDSAQRLNILGEEEEEPTSTKIKTPAPQPAKRTSLVSKPTEGTQVVNKNANHQPDTITPQPTGKISSASINSVDMYSSIDSKDSGSSWGRSTSSLEKRDKPVMAVKPVMKFVQGEAWKQDIKRNSSGGVLPNSERPAPIGQATALTSSSNTMRVFPQQQSENAEQDKRRKVRPNPPPRQSVSQSSISSPPRKSTTQTSIPFPLQGATQNNIPLQERPSRPPASRPSTSSNDSASGSKPAPPRPPPPRPSGPPPTPAQSGVVMRNKNNPNNSNPDKRKSTLRRAAQSYHSAEQGHLNFQQDSFIKELGEVPGKPGWMLGMLADGTTGIYPQNRVEELSPGGVRVSRV